MSRARWTEEGGATPRSGLDSHNGHIAGEGSPGGVTERSSCRVRLYLLGGFRVEHGGVPVPQEAWLRRDAARTLVKILASYPGHRLHRDQITDMIWPAGGGKSARNQFSKALHAARRALEPDLTSGKDSLYLHLVDEVLTLDTSRVWIDVDHFQTLAEAALASGDLAMLETAGLAYSGELLPEDLYDDWAIARRDWLTELHIQILLEMSQILEQRGMPDRAIERLHAVLDRDPTREEVHRGLMNLYALRGSHQQALRQYEVCRDVLRKELDVEPEEKTERLYEAIVKGTGPFGKTRPAEAPHPLPLAIQRAPLHGLVGRDRVMHSLLDDFHSAMAGSGRTVLLSGEVGIGKTRLAAEVAREAWRRGALILWGASYDQESFVPYRAFVEALEQYLMAGCEEERRVIAGRYPEMAGLVPALALPTDVSPLPVTPSHERGTLFTGVARFLSDLAEHRPVVLVLDGLCTTESGSLQLLQHLACSAIHRRWLILGTYRDENLAVGSELSFLTTTAVRQGLVRRIALCRLAYEDCSSMVQELLGQDPVDPSLVRRLYTLSLGNPLFLEELVQAMYETGHLALLDDGWQASPLALAAVPDRIRDLVEERIAHLTADARRLLSAASAAGMESSFTLLRVAAEMNEGATLDALDLALKLGILEERGDRFAFRHPLFRQAVYEQLSAQRRFYLHMKLAEAIAREEPYEVEALAYHYARTRDGDRTSLHLQPFDNASGMPHAREAVDDYYRALIECWQLVETSTVLTLARQKLVAALTVQTRSEEAEMVFGHASAAHSAVDESDG